eukprot:3218476-Amphidinium_carterae.2
MKELHQPSHWPTRTERGGHKLECLPPPERQRGWCPPKPPGVVKKTRCHNRRKSTGPWQWEGRPNAAALASTWYSAVGNFTSCMASPKSVTMSWPSILTIGSAGRVTGPTSSGRCASCVAKKWHLATFKAMPPADRYDWTSGLAQVLEEAPLWCPPLSLSHRGSPKPISPGC